MNSLIRNNNAHKVPYEAMDRAALHAQSIYPDAVRIKPIMSMGEILLEVWYGDGHADVVHLHDE